MNSLWLSEKHSLAPNFFTQEKQDFSTDVCIIGGGIFGLTSAYYLTKKGLSVTVLEKDTIGSKATGHTTAKITSQHGLFYDYLLHSFGEKFSKDYFTANETAIENIEKIIQEEKISCDFQRQNHYVYTTQKKNLSKVKKEIDALNTLGYPCELVTKTGLPFEIEGAICFKNQAQFHPIKYLFGLCNFILNHGGKIVEHTTVLDVKNEEDSCITFTNDFNLSSKYVIFASHYPFVNMPGFYFLKMYQSTSYLIAIDPQKTLFHGMYISCDDPVFSFRTASYQGKELLLIGGGEHKTGQPPSYQNTYGLLEKEAKKYYPNCEVLYRWNTRDCVSLDKLPYIGSYSSTMPNIFVATGFKKWGMTLSNVASQIIVNKICKETNPYAYLFDPSRLKPIKNRDEMKNMLVQSTNSLLLNKLRPTNMEFDNIANNSGSIIEINHQKVGIYKSPEGKLYAVKPICTHLGCLLSWNDVDKTWDCPCHGSRFRYDGKNLYDPAFKDLETYSLDD